MRRCANCFQGKAFNLAIEMVGDRPTTAISLDEGVIAESATLVDALFHR